MDPKNIEYLNKRRIDLETDIAQAYAECLPITEILSEMASMLDNFRDLVKEVWPGYIEGDAKVLIPYQRWLKTLPSGEQNIVEYKKAEREIEDAFLPLWDEETRQSYIEELEAIEEKQKDQVQKTTVLDEVFAEEASNEEATASSDVQQESGVPNHG